MAKKPVNVRHRTGNYLIVWYVFSLEGPPDGRWRCYGEIGMTETRHARRTITACAYFRTTETALLFGEKLLAEDVRVPAVLGELPQRVHVDPAQRQRAAPVAVDRVVQAQR